jgi:protein-L-isoaspartate(D-aspartate) O-methyltransferase
MDYAAARLNMVESQVRTNKVTDPAILAAMLELPRERFVPPALQGVAYVDDDIPISSGPISSGSIGNARYLLEPMVQARLLQTAAIEPSDNVLEIGTGLGYGAAILDRLAARVVALESDAALAEAAKRTLAALGASRVTVVRGALEAGWPPAAPYRVIVFAGAVQRVPPTIESQLAEGGRMVVVIAPPGEPGKATLIQRIGGVIARRVVFDAASALLPGFAVEPGFVF